MTGKQLRAVSEPANMPSVGWWLPSNEGRSS